MDQGTDGWRGGNQIIFCFVDMAFRWWADDGPFIAVLRSNILASTKKMLSNLDPL